MSWLSSFLHPEKGYQKGQQQLDKYYGQSQGYLAPFAEHGNEAYGELSNAMRSLLDPEALNNKWISGYNESEAAKNLEEMAQEHGLNAASSMGIMGSTPALQAIQAGTSQIGAADRQQYLNNLMNMYKEGTGIGQNVYGVGANAGTNMAQNATNMGENSARNAFGAENAGGDMFSKLLGALIGGAGGAWSGGMFGGNKPMNNAWSTGGQ